MQNYNNEIKLQETLLYQENTDNLTPTRIMEFVRHFYDVQRPRLQKLDAYSPVWEKAIKEKLANL